MARRPTRLEAKLEDLIRSHCGSLVKQVEVQERADGNWVIRVTVPSVALERLALTKLLQMPEIRSPKVELQVNLASQ